MIDMEEEKPEVEDGKEKKSQETMQQMSQDRGKGKEFMNDQEHGIRKAMLDKETLIERMAAMTPGMKEEDDAEIDPDMEQSKKIKDMVQIIIKIGK